MTIFSSSSLSAVLELSTGAISELSGGLDSESVLSIDHGDPGFFRLLLRGEGEMVWPNREGEGFSLHSVLGRLKKLACDKTGISISWPATASVQGVTFSDADGRKIFFYCLDEKQGIHREIRILSKIAGTVELLFSGSPARWAVRNCGIQEANTADSVALPPESPRYQFQLGLINPWGATSVPPKTGFSIIPILAQRFLKSFGPFKKPPLIHLFGYGAGHDRNYPDYTPSTRLGGPNAFAQALSEVKALGFAPSCYLNARLMDCSAGKEFGYLKPGITLDDYGAPIMEVYQDRSFYVMNPNYGPWLDELYKQVLKLKTLGAEVVQLDQVAGRVPTVKPGEVWGQGYRDLIQRIQDEGLKVWIQGVCDYYPANWFEMTYRDVSILDGGILRGGMPLGKVDLSLLKSRSMTGSYLIPRSKLQALSVDDRASLEIIRDVLGDGGVQPIYGTDYLAELESIEKSGLS